MHRFGLILCVLATFVAGLHPAAAQVRTDSLFSWQGYARAGRCHIRIFEPAPDLDRQSVIVIRELADNSGPTTVNDIAYLVEEVSRGFALAPDSALWIVHWGAFSFEGAADASGKELFLRATFKKSEQGRLSAPQWRVISRNDVVEYTDRAFR
ncbi:MAG: hypothetical protein SH809_02705 [Rhodothermales bacterium]|nr:hypothetical protein [Rhodothermales bacterium]